MSFVSSCVHQSPSHGCDCNITESKITTVDSVSFTNTNPTQMTISFNTSCCNQDMDQMASTSNYSLVPSTTSSTYSQMLSVEHTFALRKMCKKQFQNITPRRICKPPFIKRNDLLRHKTRVRGSEMMLYSLSQSSLIRKPPILRCPRWMSNLARNVRAHSLRVEPGRLSSRCKNDTEFLPTIAEESEAGEVQDVLFELNNFAIQPFYSQIRTPARNSTDIVNSLGSLSIRSQPVIPVVDSVVEDICERLHELPFAQPEVDSVNSLKELFDFVTVNEDQLTPQ